ncbi:hypothetical protein [Beijerinckia sp. L45]|uniref:hypothetical protein n=1 Tax=Beijerinckia sp. L45 TaxID=1641855 RepID=UPI00131D43FB|nr:hypothetical protein [Beijerinckia sp. L45]
MQMTAREQKVLDQTIEIVLDRGSAIIAERHDILTRMIEDDIAESEREALAQRFLHLGIQWHLLTATGQTKH